MRCMYILRQWCISAKRRMPSDIRVGRYVYSDSRYQIVASPASGNNHCFAVSFLAFFILGGWILFVISFGMCEAGKCFQQLMYIIIPHIVLWKLTENKCWCYSDSALSEVSLRLIMVTIDILWSDWLKENKLRHAQCFIRCRGNQWCLSCSIFVVIEPLR